MRSKIFDANAAGSSMAKPELSSAASKRSSAVAAAAETSPAATRALRSKITGDLGLISIVFLPFMYSCARLSPMACAFMMRSMFADQPNLDVTRMHGVSVRRLDTATFSTLPAPRVSWSQSVRGFISSSISVWRFFSSSSTSPRSRSSLEMSTSFFSLYCVRLAIATSSMGSIMNKTSYPFLVSCSRKGEFSAAARVSAAT